MGHVQGAEIQVGKGSYKVNLTEITGEKDGLKNFKFFLKKYLHYFRKCNIIIKSLRYMRLTNASLVKRLRRCPLTAESAVRFRYEVLTVYNSPTRSPECEYILGVLFYYVQ